MNRNDLTRRAALRYGAVGLLGGVGATGSAEGATTTEVVVSNVGYDEGASYEFTVSGTVEALDSPAGDSADGSRAWGSVHGWKDGYRFSGGIVSFSHDGPVDVFVDGEAVDPAGLGGDSDGHRIAVGGTGTKSTYEFSVSGTITGATDLSGVDSYSGSSASGAVYGWRDAYTYTGEVTAFSHDGPVDVSVDGEAVDPATLGREAWRTLVVSNVGYDENASYEFAVSDAVEALDSPAGDSADGSRAWGAVANWKDGYRFRGDVVSFSHDGPVDVSVDGEAVDPATLGGGGGKWRKVVVSNVEYDEGASYEFAVSDAVEALDSPAGDNADGSRAWGSVHGWKDGYRFSGEIVSFSNDGPVDVFVDGDVTDPSTLADDGGGSAPSVRTRGTPLHDTDDWSDWSGSATTEATGDRSVSYRGSRSLRLDVTDGRLDARYDPGSPLDLSGERLSLTVRWEAPERAVRLFVTLVDSDGNRSEFVAPAPRGMSGAGGGWVRCPVAKRLGEADDADLTDVESIRLWTWTMRTGTVRVDDVRVHDRPDRGRVAFSFDDSKRSRRRAVEVLNERGVAGTLFTITHRVGESGEVTVADLNDAKAAGWDVGSHPQHADSLAAMTASEAASAMDADREWLRDRGFDPEIMSWPYGVFDADALAAADERYDLAFSTVGSPAAGEISTPMNVGRLNGNTADADGDGTPDDARRAIDRAAEFGELAVLNYHNVGVGGSFSIPRDRLAATVDHALDADVDVVTCTDLLP